MYDDRLPYRHFAREEMSFPVDISMTDDHVPPSGSKLPGPAPPRESVFDSLTSLGYYTSDIGCLTSVGYIAVAWARKE